MDYSTTIQTIKTAITTKQAELEVLQTALDIFEEKAAPQVSELQILADTIEAKKIEINTYLADLQTKDNRIAVLEEATLPIKESVM